MNKQIICIIRITMIIMIIKLIIIIIIMMMIMMIGPSKGGSLNNMLFIHTTTIHFISLYYSGNHLYRPR